MSEFRPDSYRVRIYLRIFKFIEFKDQIVETGEEIEIKLVCAAIFNTKGTKNFTKTTKVLYERRFLDKKAHGN
ncbi:hypothetical protein MgSA37_02123 [Mucilaginibacter gotjawali]|uniref:Uncharacterized protein n=2 Tax=Mucilaginibacter gotjawali TaxID=1550579 RepID=A0A120MXV5_9SPHI|nr:hypothetical protein [Mucilaginibacter gotjawali]BAU53952.1 hypothetical protein MgSA37_02123 [Mucilaginibacter gotjawali]